MKAKTPALLIILDGFGLRTNPQDNAVLQARMPHWDYFTQKYAYSSLNASEQAVGLPQGQFGNSEVGHLNIGAGRVVEQYITRIDTAIMNGEFNCNPVFSNALNTTTTGVLHIMGLLSDGGVHSHITHIIALIKLAQSNTKIKQIYIHVFLDGRDTPPRSALLYTSQLTQYLNKHTQVATVSGRYYAMDRDKRYERIQAAYLAIMDGKSEYHGTNMEEIIHNSYANGLNDEFIHPHVIADYTGVQDGDSIIFANFRSDRAIALSDAITNVEFNQFPRRKVTLSHFICMTSYEPKLNLAIAFSQQVLSNTLGEYIASLGLHQLRIAETEKYPHITFFFNGGKKDILLNEDRILVPSPRDVATYDLKPQMSLIEVTQQLKDAIHTKKYDLIVTNFANADMVGHSGNLPATICAVEALDDALGEVIPAMLSMGGEILVIADHGNCEEMFDYVANQPHTQHTTNLVPCLYVGRQAHLKSNATLQDVAPTILSMMGLPQPIEMTGTNIIEFI